jgi:hypothetical protein
MFTLQDVANMFGPSVGARALSMRQALLVAAVFEFLGAVLMVRIDYQPSTSVTLCLAGGAAPAVHKPL